MSAWIAVCVMCIKSLLHLLISNLQNTSFLSLKRILCWWFRHWWCRNISFTLVSVHGCLAHCGWQWLCYSRIWMLNYQSFDFRTDITTHGVIMFDLPSKSRNLPWLQWSASSFMSFRFSQSELKNEIGKPFFLIIWQGFVIEIQWPPFFGFHPPSRDRTAYYTTCQPHTAKSPVRKLMLSNMLCTFSIFVF